MPDGTFSGMVGMIQRRKADVTLAIAMPSEGRSRVMDQSLALLRDGLKIHAQTSSGYMLSTYSLFDVFNRYVWASIVGIVMLVALLKAACTMTYSLSSSTSPLLVTSSQQEALLAFRLISTYIKSLAVAIRWIINQGYQDVDGRLLASLKILMFTVGMTTVILFGCLTGSILSKLAVVRPKYKVESLQDVLEAHNYKIGIPRDGFIQGYFKVSLYSCLA